MKIPKKLKPKDAFLTAEPLYTNPTVGIGLSAPSFQLGLEGKYGKKKEWTLKPHIGYGYNVPKGHSALTGGIDASYKGMANSKHTGNAVVNLGLGYGYGTSAKGEIINSPTAQKLAKILGGFDAGYQFNFGAKNRRKGEIKPGKIAGSLMPYAGANVGDGLIYGGRGNFEWRPKFGNKAPFTVFGGANLNFGPARGKDLEKPSVGQTVYGATNLNTGEIFTEDVVSQTDGIRFKPTFGASLGIKIPIDRVKNSLPSFKRSPLPYSEDLLPLQGDTTYASRIPEVNSSGKELLGTYDESVEDFKNRRDARGKPGNSSPFITQAMNESPEDYDRIYKPYVPKEDDEYALGGQLRFLKGQNYIDKELTDKEIKKYRAGGYIVEDISVPQLEEGGRIQKYQRAGEYKEGVQDIQEVTHYGNEAKRKLQGSLIEKLIQSKKAYQDYRENAGLTKQRLRDEGASSIGVLKGQIKEYRGQLEEEKKSFAMAQSALKQLQVKDPKNWKDKKLKDVLSSQGVDALRSLYKAGKMSDDTFKDFYDNFGNQYDREATKTTADDQVKLEDSWYGKKDEEGRRRWMSNPMNVAKVAQGVAMAAPLAPLAIMGAPAVLGASSGFLPAAQTAFNTSMLGVPGLTANNLLWGAGAYMSGDQIIDPNSATRTSINTAIKDPTLSNIGEAAANTTMTALGFAGLPIKAGVASLADDVTQAGKYLQKGYNQVATGNSALPLAWKLEKPTGLMSGAAEKSRNYIARTYTNREAELLSGYGKGMNFTPEEWSEMQALTKSGATDFSKSDIPITRIPLYYNRSEQAVNEAKALNKLRLWQKFDTPSEKNIRTWSAGIPEGFDAERLARSTPLQKTRLVVPSKYTKGLGDDFSAMPYDDTRVDFIYPKNDRGLTKAGQFNVNASAENELMGNIPEGFIKIGSSNEGGFNNIIIKPIGKKSKELTKQLPGSSAASSVDDVGKGITQSSNKIDQTIIDDYTKREIDWLNSEEYIKRNMAATGKTREAVMKETDKIIKQVNKTTLNTLDDKADMAAGVYVQDKNKPLINLFNTGDKKLLLNTADHEIKHAASQLAIRSTDGLIDLVTNPYKKYPTINVKKWYDNFIPGESATKWASNAPEQQVVSKRIMDLVEKTQGVKRGTQLTDDNIKGVIDLLNKDIKAQNFADSDIITMMHSFKSKFGKDYYKQIKEMVNKAYVVPAAIGTGAALQQKQNGGFIEAELTQKEIDWYKSNGCIVEELD